MIEPCECVEEMFITHLVGHMETLQLLSTSLHLTENPIAAIGKCILKLFHFRFACLSPSYLKLSRCDTLQFLNFQRKSYMAFFWQTFGGNMDYRIKECH